MAKQGENIYCRKDGRWEGKYIKNRINGKIRYGYVSGRSYEEVLFKKRKKLQSRGDDNVNATDMPLSISNLSAEWLEARRHTFKQTTYEKYSDLLEHYILPKYGHWSVADITRDEILAYLDDLMREGGTKKAGLSPKSAQGIVSVLRLVLNYASENRHISVADLGRIRIKHSKRPLRVLTKNEQKQLENGLAEQMDLCGLGIMTCLYTGIRLGEVCALKWKDVRLQEDMLDIHATMERVRTRENPNRRTEIIITPPKSDCSIRCIPLPANLQVLMENMKCPEDTFFLTGQTDAFIDPRTMQNRFKVLLDRSHIENVNFHALRHTFATRCIELGFDVKSLSEILGHANVNITMNRYVHPTMDLKQQNMNRLAEVMNGI